MDPTRGTKFLNYQFILSNINYSSKRYLVLDYLNIIKEKILGVKCILCIKILTRGQKSRNVPLQKKKKNPKI